MQISTHKIPRRYIPLIIVFAVLVLFMPRTAKFNFDYKKGSPWPYETLISQFDFPILKTEEQIRDERGESGTVIIPYYRFSDEQVSMAVRNVQALDLGSHQYVRQAVVQRMQDIYAKGIISDAKVKFERPGSEVSENLIYVQKNKRATRVARSEVYKVSEARDQLVALVAKSHPSVNLDSLFRRSGLYGVIVPNLIYDRAMTELTHAELDDYVSPTMGYVKADEKIVARGEIVTAEVAQILDSYKEEYNKVYGYDGPRILLYLGNIIIGLALVLLLYLVIYFTNRLVFDDGNRYFYLLTVYILSAVVTFLMQKHAPGLMYLIPYPVFALYLLAFFRKRLVMPFYVIMLLPLLIFCGNGMELFVMFLTAGTVTIETFSGMSKGWRQFINAAIIFGIEVLIYAGFHFIDVGSNSAWWLDVVLIFVGSMLTVLAYPLIFLFEKIFNLVSSTRLEELADTASPLLQELSAKAPGTFQHSLQVMNLVDAVGRAVDANVPLLRAGALYHDIGKMQNPLCFVENQSASAGGLNYHEGKSPAESAADIIRHVDDGLAIADEYRLPSEVKAFIASHHGTSAASFFLNKYLNEGGDPADTSAFYYHGQKPTTKEQVILMVCDSIEAASRTLTDFSPESCDRFVENIVAGKEKSGQLADSDITIRELGLMKSMLKTYLQQIHHGRVAYPKRSRRHA